MCAETQFAPLNTSVVLSNTLADGKTSFFFKTQLPKSSSHLQRRGHPRFKIGRTY